MNRFKNPALAALRLFAFGALLATGFVSYGIGTAVDASAQLLLNGEPETENVETMAGPPYVAVMTGDIARSSLFGGSQVSQAQGELNVVLDRIAEQPFTRWCAFNGHAAINKDSRERRHDYPCLMTDSYAAVSVGDRIKLFKVSRGIMIEQLSSTYDARRRHQIVDFEAVRKSFGIETPAR